MNKSVNVRITNELKSPATLGIHYRFLCLTGPEKGKVYYLLGKRIIIGRGEHVDIQVLDAKTSREHAELSFVGNGYTITDIGAQNGIMVNDSRIKQKSLVDAEKVVIGQTVFKYNVIEVTGMDVEEYSGNENEDERNDKQNKLKKSNIKKQVKIVLTPDLSGVKNQSKINKNPKFLIFGIVGLVGIYFLMNNDEVVKTKKANNVNPVSDFDAPEATKKKQNQDDLESKKKLDNYIHTGRREFSEGNYFRAMEDFRLALLLSPNNGHASFYLSKSKQRLDEEIEKNFLKGKQEYESKKLQASIVSYCSVVQLIQNYPDDERYKNAMLKISAIESELGLEKGEVKCFEEKSPDSGR